MVAKILFLWNPTMTVFHFIGLKSAASLIFMYLFFKIDIKKILFSSVNKSQYKPLAMKTISGVAANILLYFGLQHLPLTEVTLIYTTTPLLILIIGFLFFH